jgi:hypothetical protein
MAEDVLSRSISIVFFFLGVVLALGLSLIIERYRK